MPDIYKIKTYQELFKRDRRCGDFVFAVVFLLFSLFLLSQLGDETKWVKKSRLFAQPSFWPAVSVIGMTVCAAFHLLGSVLSTRIYGRLEEVTFWIRSFEYAAWFLLYVWVVPIIGYLSATVILLPTMAFRVGYKDRRTLLLLAMFGFFVVVVFKSLLAVKIPGGAIYEYFPDAIRSFMLVNF